MTDSPALQLKEEYSTIVIGAGPAGLFAAINIENPKETLLIEKNSRPGRKLLLSGAGRCNITHEGDILDFFDKYGDNGGFLRKALTAFTNEDLVKFLRSKDIRVYADKNGKIFPDTDKALSVLQALSSQIKHKGAHTLFDSRVTRIVEENDKYKVFSSDSQFICSNLVIACGGASYPKTGSSGDSNKLAVQLNHTVVDFRPALTDIEYAKFEFAELSGISFDDLEVSLIRNGKLIKKRQGDVLFTFKGLSGPGIMDLSRYFNIGDKLVINLLGVEAGVLDKDLISAITTKGSTKIKNFLKNYDIADRLIDVLLKKAGINLDLKISEVSKIQRKSIVKYFCETEFPIEKIGKFDKAMVSAGGVNLKEINSATMESRISPNLYFIGESLDIDGDTGGYNLQAAFSTAKLCATSINAKNR
jgi:predicted Rossmann fold flavoprotein